MIVAGIDIGSRNSKAVIMEDGRISSYAICDTGPESAKTASTVTDEALKGTGLLLRDINYVVATGYGRVLVPFAEENITEISCHAKGAHWYFPTARTILDMGGQDCKAINCNERGQVTKFVMNDRCAGGTGRFLELMAELFRIPLEQIGEVALQSERTIPFTTGCALYAKSEAMSLLKKGESKKDLLAAIHVILSARSLDLLRRISIEADFVISGGVSKNIGMVTKLREKVGLEPLIAPEPLIIGAVGAALFAEERFQNQMVCPGAFRSKSSFM